MESRYESEPRFLHPRSESTHRRQLPDRCEHRLVVDELLNAMERRLATLPVELGGLLAKEPVDVGIAFVLVGSTRGHERLDPRGRVPERRTRAQDEILELLLDLSLVVRRPLERPELHANTGGLQIIGHGLADARVNDVAREIARVESVRISRFRQELFRLGP